MRRPLSVPAALRTARDCWKLALTFIMKTCFTDGCLLAVSSHSEESQLISLHPFIRTAIFSWVSPHITSSEPHYLPEALPPSTIALGIRVFAY